MKTRALLLLTVAAFTLPLAAHAKSRPHAHAASATYQCPICHHKVSAAQAKSLHYVCPVDHGKLALIKTAILPKSH